MNSISKIADTNKLSKNCHKAKKITAVVVTALITMVMASMFAMAAFAEGEGGGDYVNTSSFISTACKVLKALIILIGGGLGVWGLVSLVEAYGSDNAASKVQ